MTRRALKTHFDHYDRCPEDHPDHCYRWVSQLVDKLVADDRRRRNVESHVLHASGKEQVKNNTGGPRNPDMLFDVMTLSSDFSTLEIIFLEKLGLVLDEGPVHQGAASVIRLLGTLAK